MRAVLEDSVVEPYRLGGTIRAWISRGPVERQVDRAQALWLGDVLSDSTRLALSPTCRVAREPRLSFPPPGRGGLDAEREGFHDLAGELRASGGRAGQRSSGVGIVQLRDDGEDEAAPLRVAEPDVFFEECRDRRRAGVRP